MLRVELSLDDRQRTKVVAAKGMTESLEKLVLPVAPEALRLLDENRVRVYPSGLLRILDHVVKEHEDELDKEFRVYMGEYGLSTSIMRELADFVIDKGKTEFDEECLQYVYKLQDEALAKARAEVEKRREEKRKYEEMERKREEARRLLSDEIERYEKRIEELESELRELKDRVSELESVIESYAGFIKEKGLEDEFVNYVMEIRRREEEGKIRKRYGL